MREYRMCTRCIMAWPDDPDITFNDKGICNHCLHFDVQEKIRRRERQNLPWLYGAIRKAGKGKPYDALIGLSGGVDSSLCLSRLVDNSIRVLAFSLDNGYNTKIAEENIMRLVEGTKTPFYRYVLDLKKFAELQMAFIKSGTKNIEIPTDHVLMAATYEMANKYDIRYIISGGNLATESIMPESWGYNARDLRFIKDVYRKHTGKELEGLPTISLLQYLYYRFVKKITVVNLLDYE